MESSSVSCHFCVIHSSFSLLVVCLLSLKIEFLEAITSQLCALQFDPVFHKNKVAFHLDIALDTMGINVSSLYMNQESA